MFFFFKQKTAYEMRISDWSSDVCSSDLSPQQQVLERHTMQGRREVEAGLLRPDADLYGVSGAGRLSGTLHGAQQGHGRDLCGAGAVCARRRAARERQGCDG